VGSSALARIAPGAIEDHRFASTQVKACLAQHRLVDGSDVVRGVQAGIQDTRLPGKDACCLKLASHIVGGNNLCSNLFSQ
jgi:hypothetical protein